MCNDLSLCNSASATYILFDLCKNPACVIYAICATTFISSLQLNSCPTQYVVWNVLYNVCNIQYFVCNALYAVYNVQCAMCGMLGPPMRAFLPDTLLLTAPITSSPNHHLHNHCNHHNANQLEIINIALNCRSLQCNIGCSAVFREHWDLWQVDRSVLSPPAVRGWGLGGRNSYMGMTRYQSIALEEIISAYISCRSWGSWMLVWGEREWSVTAAVEWSKYCGRVWRNTNGKMWEIQKRRCGKYKWCGTRLTMVGRTKTDCRSVSNAPTHWFCHQDTNSQCLSVSQTGKQQGRN